MKNSFLLLLLLCGFLPLTGKTQDSDIDTKMEKMAQDLSKQLRAAGKTRIGVADFIDLRGNVTELGKYVAENFQGALINQQLRVINRQRLSQLLTENKLTAQGLLDPANSLKIGKVAGMEVIIVGTITPIDDRNIAINLQALDVQGAEAIASAKTSLNRTQSLNDLLLKVVGTESENYNDGRKINNDGSYEVDLPKNRCEEGGWGYGVVCFKNRFNEPLLLYKITQPNIMTVETNILIAPGAEGCSPLILLATK